MKTLLETLKSSAPLSPTPVDQQQTEAILTTKATGLAVPLTSTAPAASSQASKLALAAGKEKQQEQSLLGRIEDVELLGRAKEQKAESEQRELSYADKLRKMSDQFQRGVGERLVDLGQKKQLLSEEQWKNEMENLTQQMRLSNRSYLDNIERAGNERRLKDKIEADEAYARAALGDKLEAMEDDLAYKKFASASDREFMEAINNMDIGFAEKLLESELRSANQTAKYESYAGMFSAGAQGAQAYSSYQRDLPKENPTTNPIEGSDVTEQDL